MREGLNLKLFRKKERILPMLSRRFPTTSVCLASMKSVVILYVMLAIIFLIGCFHSKQGQREIVVKANVIDIVPQDEPVPNELCLKYVDELLYRALKERDEMETPSEEILGQIMKLNKINKMLTDAEGLSTDAKSLLEDYRKTYGYANGVE